MRRMIELTARHRQESELETERLCSAQQQAERLLDTRERSHRQQVKELEEQVCRSALSLQSRLMITCSFYRLKYFHMDHGTGAFASVALNIPKARAANAFFVYLETRETANATDLGDSLSAATVVLPRWGS